MNDYNNPNLSINIKQWLFLVYHGVFLQNIEFTYYIRNDCSGLCKYKIMFPNLYELRIEYDAVY